MRALGSVVGVIVGWVAGVWVYSLLVADEVGGVHVGAFFCGFVLAVAGGVGGYWAVRSNEG